MRASVLACVGFVALAAGLVGQDRKPLLGTVVGADGKPVAGATVHLTFVPRGSENEGPVDAPTATTDARGRFRADVLSCAPYRCWAMGPELAGGARFVSDVVVVAAGDPVELRAAAERTPVVLQVKGLDKWQDLAPFSVRTWQCGAVAEWPLVAAGTVHEVALPPQPTSSTAVEVRDGKGNVLYVGRPDFARPTAMLVVPEPQLVPMRVVDEKGAPVAGARIEQRIQLTDGWEDLLPAPPPADLRRPLGITDAEGVLKANVAAKKNPFRSSDWQQLTFLASAPGRASALAGFNQEPYCNGKGIARAGLTELGFTLGPAKPLRGRVVAGERALAGVPLVVQTGIQVRNRGGGSANEPWRCPNTTDAEGRFVCEAMVTDATATVLLGAMAVAGSGPAAEWLRFSPPHPYLLHRLGQPAGDVVIDLFQHRILQLRILDETKGPARGVQVLFASREGGECDAWCAQAVPDGAGRLAVRPQRGSWLVFARNETSMAHQVIDVTRDVEVTLQLEPMPTMRGRVVDGDGKPVAGARLTGHSSEYRKADDAEALKDVASRLNWNWIGRTTSDASGSFACRFLALGQSYNAYFLLDDRRSEVFVLDVNCEAKVTMR